MHKLMHPLYYFQSNIEKNVLISNYNFLASDDIYATLQR